MEIIDKEAKEQMTELKQASKLLHNWTLADWKIEEKFQLNI